MNDNIELEVCANCKREIPHYNYVMHTAHCARNISVCAKCKEPIPKTEFDKHTKLCINVTPKAIKPPQPLHQLEKSSYFVARKEIEDKKVQQRQEKRMERMEKLVDVGEPTGYYNKPPSASVKSSTTTQDLLPCQYCELELPKLDLLEHENYCGARTEKCTNCGEHVMFKYRQLHIDTNHGLLNPDSHVQESPRRRPLSFAAFDTYTPTYTYNPNSPSLLSTTSSSGEKLETSKEISRRLDCKTEYIRNLLHDSASITAPLRSTGAVPRNRQNVSESPIRRRNPPTELVIPCEFCNTPVPHEDLIEHETGCRPDLARYNPHRERDELDYFVSPEPASPDVELPCEFCSDLIPASQLLTHQAACI